MIGIKRIYVHIKATRLWLLTGRDGLKNNHEYYSPNKVLLKLSDNKINVNL